MTPWQNNPAMVDFRWRAAWLLKDRRAFPLNQRSTASGTPIRRRVEFHFGMAMAAN
jgi:hypothetical protein